MPTLEELKQQAKDLKIKNSWLTKKEFKYLPKILAADEALKAFASGFMNRNTWLIVVTNKRVIFLDRGLLYGLKQVDIPLTKINSIVKNNGLVFGEINIWDGASKTNIRNIPKEDATNFVNAVNEAIDSLQHNNINNSSSLSDELLKLAELKERGILTEEEFNKKKTELLDKF